MNIRLVACLAMIGALGCDKSGDASASENASDSADKSGDKGSASYAFADLPECVELVSKMEECGDKESLVQGKKDGIQKDIDKGLSKDTINNKCSIGNKAYRCSKKGKGRDKEKEEKESDKPSSDAEPASGGDFGIAACDDYMKVVDACKTFKKDSFIFKKLVASWRQDIADGKSSEVEQKCKKAAEMFLCPKK